MESPRPSWPGPARLGLGLAGLTASGTQAGLERPSGPGHLVGHVPREYPRRNVPCALGPVCCSPLPSNYRHLPLYERTPYSRPMSHTHPTAGSSSSSSLSNFQRIINNALDTYKKRTRNDLCAHPLAAQLQACDSPTAILALLRQQVQGLDQSRSTDERWTKWLDPTVNVLSAFSDILGSGVSLVCFRSFTSLRLALLYMSQVFSPASVIFAGVGQLLSVCILTVITFRGPL